jgi:RNA polymerase sigma-70 factor (ECF subfamily)
MLASTPAEVPSEQAGIANEIVGELLAQLSPRDRLVITLLHLEERTIEEIKNITGWNTALIKVRAFRARRKMARLYASLKEPR